MKKSKRYFGWLGIVFAVVGAALCGLGILRNNEIAFVGGLGFLGLGMFMALYWLGSR